MYVSSQKQCLFVLRKVIVCFIEIQYDQVYVWLRNSIYVSLKSNVSACSTDTDHGPARFLIFSLLIPYIHREGPVGQKARDALLLIMTLSARHPHIGHYIANNSDFCPVSSCPPPLLSQ